MSDDYLLSLWRSWAQQSSLGHAGAATGTRGRSRMAGPSFEISSRVPHPSSPAARQMMPGELERLHAQEALEGLVHRLLSQSSFAHAQRLARQILGADSFGLGVCFGLVSYPAQEVVDLLALGQTFLLADLHDQVCGPLSVRSFIGPTAGSALFMRGLFAFGEGMWIRQRLVRAQQQRDLIFLELKSIMENPAEFFVGLPARLQESYQTKWQRFVVQHRAKDLRSQFEAGKILGELLMELLVTLASLVAMGATVVKLGAKAPQLLKAAQRVKPRISGSNAARVSEKTRVTAPARKASPALESKQSASSLPPLHPKVLAELDRDPRGVHGWLPKPTSGYGGTEQQRLRYADPEFVGRNRAIRKDYLQGSKSLERDIAQMRAEGRSPEDIARHVVDRRNQQKLEARALMRPEEAQRLEQRNIARYGNPVGPSADNLYEKYKNDWTLVTEKSMEKDPVINTLLGLSPES